MVMYKILGIIEESNCLLIMDILKLVALNLNEAPCHKTMKKPLK